MRHSTQALTADIAWLAAGPLVVDPRTSLTNLVVFAACLPVAHFASRGADFDHPRSKIGHEAPGLSKRFAKAMGGHRMGSHSIFAPMVAYVLGGIAVIIVWAFLGLVSPSTEIPAVVLPAVAAASGIGWAGGIFPDLLTVSGIGLLYPLTRRRVRLLRLRTSEPKPAAMLPGELAYNAVQILVGVYFAAALLAAA